MTIQSGGKPHALHKTPLQCARLARHALVMSYPRDAAWVRVAMGLLNVGQWLMRRSFRAFVHPAAALVATAEAVGLRLSGRGEHGVWEFAAFRR